MSSDPNRKSPRTFQCRDVLWETFEQMARELECSVDYLINEAMKQYARQRTQNSGRSTFSRQDTTQQDPRGGSYPGGPSPAPPPSMRSARGSLPPPPQRGSGLPAPSAPPRGSSHGGMGAPPPRMQSNRPSSVPRGAVPPPVPSRTGGSIPAPSNLGGGYNGGLSPQGAPLSIVYQGERFSVSKDRFVIGRGKQSSDLTLKDPNVSRQHAMIEFQNGVYFMVDMGSTNGVEYNGQRIARKQIAEGDTFRICDHDLRFTYR